MTHKHTPGPWSTDEAEHDEPYQDINIRAGSRPICRVWKDDAPVRDYNAEQDADAKLIAAAPDLLEALEDLLQTMEQHEQLAGGACIYGDNARAAIAKATS